MVYYYHQSIRTDHFDDLTISRITRILRQQEIRKSRRQEVVRKHRHIIYICIRTWPAPKMMYTS